MRFAVVDGLRFRHFDEEAVVFHPLSWDAHLLNPAASAVVELLLESPRSESDVAAFLKDSLEPGERGQAEAHATRLVEHLRLLGLIRPV